MSRGVMYIQPNPYGFYDHRDANKGNAPRLWPPRLFLRRLRGSLLRLRSMMRLEVKPVAREWHSLGNEGHDRLITAGYRSSHSCGYATAAGQDYRDTSKTIDSDDPPPVTQLSSCPDQSFIRPGTTSCVSRDLPDARIAQVHSGSRCL